MQQNNLKLSNKKVGIVLSYIVLFGILFLDIYLFFSKEAIMPKILAGSSFIILLSLLVVLLKQTVKNNKHVDI